MSQVLAHSGEFHGLQWLVIVAAVVIPSAAMLLTVLIGGKEK